MNDINTAFKINIKYSCLECSLKNIVLEVPARGDEDVVTWMKNLSGQTSRKITRCAAQNAQQRAHKR